MAKFDEFVGKYILLAVLVLGFFSFIIILQENNNSVDPIKDNPIFKASFNSLSNAIVNSSAASQEKYAAFNSEQPVPGFGSIILLSIVSVGKSFSEIVFGFFAAIIKLPLVVLGIPATIYNLVITYMIISIIVAAWLLYKLGG